MDETISSKLDLAAVAKTVAETDRRRALVEEKLNQAQSVVAALSAESRSLQESVLELKRELEETAQAKEAETAALGRTAEERRRAIDELKALTAAADELRSVSERKSAAIGANLDAARNELAALDSSVGKARADATSLDEMVVKLRDTVVEARRQAEALDAQLGTVAKASRSAVDGAADIQRRIEDARAALDTAAARKNETEETCEALAAITSALRSKTSDAVVAVKAMDDMIAEQARQSNDLARRLSAVADLVGQERDGTDKSNGRSAANGRGAANGKHAAAEPPGAAQFAGALRSIALLEMERQLGHDESARMRAALETGDGERALREAWTLSNGGPMPSAHRLLFGEVLQAMGDVRAAIVYFEQAASAKNAPTVVRYLAGAAYVRMDLLDRSALVSQLLARDRGGRLLGRIVDGLRAEHTSGLDEAVRALTDAANMRGFPKWQYDEAYYQLGGVYERHDTPEAAIAAYEQINSGAAPYAGIVDRVRALF